MEFTGIDTSWAGSAERLRRQLGQFSAGTQGGLDRLAGLWRGQRPALTLLCVAEGRVIRVDADAKGGLLGEPRRLPVECPSNAELSAAVGKALQDNPGLRLWVLYDGLSNQSLSLPAVQVVGLSDQALGQALLLEMENLSGVALQNQQIAHRSLGQSDGQNQYWASHAPMALAGQLQRVARQHRCRFDGLSHPGGLPQALSREAGAWARLEVWPDALFGLHGSGPGSAKLWMMQANAKIHRLQAEVERWHASVGAATPLESLGHGAALDFLPEHTKALDFDDDETLRRWLTGWLETLRQGLPVGIPVLEPPEDSRRELYFMAGGAAAAVLLCLTHAAVQYSRIHTHEADLVFLKGSQSRVFSAESELKRYQGQVDSLKKRLEPAKDGRAAPTPEVLAALRRRPAILLRELSLNATDGLLVETIKTKPDSVVVKGVGLDVDEVNRLDTALGSRLRGLGWQTGPALKKDLGLDEAGGPWEFEIPLMDTGLAGFAAQPKENRP